MPDLDMLRSILQRVENCAPRGDAQLDAEVVAALIAPAGAYVKCSPINGAWCIYDGTKQANGRPRLWEDGPWAFGETRRITASIDAAVALVERCLPGWPTILTTMPTAKIPRRYVATVIFVPPEEKAWGVNYEAGGASMALALCSALLKALIARPTPKTVEQDPSTAEQEEPAHVE